MDKLKPILAQKFWILSGICLLLPLTGWWMSTAAMSNEYKTRSETIQKAYDGIPKPGPNNNWTQKVVALNTEEERKVKETGQYLWDQEKPLMVWPGTEELKASIEQVGYRGEVDAKTRGEYRYAYDQAIVDLHASVEPYDHATGTGWVDYPLEKIPSLEWGKSPIPPSSKEMWDSQEDLWLFQALLQAVHNINVQHKATSIVDAKIKQIVVLELRGGTVGGAAVAKAAQGGPPGAGGAVPSGGPPTSGAGPGGAAPSMMAGPGKGGGAQAGAMGGGSGASLSATFDPAEQLGPDTEASGGGAAPGGTTPPSAGGAGPMPTPMGNLGGGGAGGGTTKKRYIEETPRYKTRGFYMEVVMDHVKLPEFLGELSDSKWPLRVIRVQQVDRDLSDVGGGNVVGAGGGMNRPSTGGTMRGPSTGGTTPMGGAGPTGGAGGAIRPPTSSKQIGGGEEAGGGEVALDLATVLADPSLVNVALSGIITIYLPPETPAAAPGAPDSTPATTTTPASVPAPPATGTTPAASGSGAATTPAATGANPAVTTPPTTSVTTPPAAAGTTPAPAADKPAVPAAPATTSAAATKPATETKPAAEGGTPAPKAGSSPAGVPGGKSPPAADTIPTGTGPAKPAAPSPPAAAKTETGK